MKDGRTRVDVRISPEIAALLQEEAAREHRSLNNLIAHVLEQHVDGAMERRTIVRHERIGKPVRAATKRALVG